MQLLPSRLSGIRRDTPRMPFAWACALGFAWVVLAVPQSFAQSLTQSLTQVPAEPAGKEATEISINEWLSRMHEAAMKKRSYVGTLVQSSQTAMSSARIWHVCNGVHQVERVEALSGAPRSSIRHNDKVVTFAPQIKLARVETREAMPPSSISDLLKPGVGSIPDFYAVQALGMERVAGYEADIVELKPRDQLRFGYRIWTERKSALVLKLQTLDVSGAVLEQAAFSELQLDAPVKASKLKAMMNPAVGWRVQQADAIKTDASAEGWALKNPVAGFKPVSCHKRGSSTEQTQDDSLQWVFSDGLATVSLFVEKYDISRHTQEGIATTGATHTLLRRLNEYFLTAVGEVPPQTLKIFALALERKK